MDIVRPSRKMGVAQTVALPRWMTPALRAEQRHDRGGCRHATALRVSKIVGGRSSSGSWRFPSIFGLRAVFVGSGTVADGFGGCVFMSGSQMDGACREQSGLAAIWSWSSGPRTSCAAAESDKPRLRKFPCWHGW